MEPGSVGLEMRRKESRSREGSTTAKNLSRAEESERDPPTEDKKRSWCKQSHKGEDKIRWAWEQHRMLGMYK